MNSKIVFPLTLHRNCANTVEYFMHTCWLHVVGLVRLFLKIFRYSSVSFVFYICRLALYKDVYILYCYNILLFFHLLYARSNDLKRRKRLQTSQSTCWNIFLEERFYTKFNLKTLFRNVQGCQFNSRRDCTRSFLWWSWSVQKHVCINASQ